MSEYDHWLHCQGGCYDAALCCHKCGEELCEHGVCPCCVGCAICDGEEEIGPASKKPSVAFAAENESRKAG